MRIAVVGAGVVGSYFGGRLAHAGEDVVFLVRGANLQAIREISKTITGAVLELEPRALRELHWHPSADEWQYVLEGKMSMTMFGSHGRFRAETLEKGDVGYIPQGYGHSIENLGDKKCRVLIGFNSGVYEDIDLTEWIGGNPLDVLATNFGKPASLFEKFPKRDVFIADRKGKK
jgi:oxalate decarboxylase